MLSIGRDLRERKIGQWAIAYVAAAWLALQVVDVVADAWSVSLLVQRSIQVTLAVGLPVTLVLAWYHGERGRQRASGPELLIIAALLAIAAGLTGLLAGGGAAAVDAEATSAMSGSAGGPGGGGAPLVPASLSARDAAQPSVAVLPFADMSAAADQGYFADGIAEEILNALARLSELHVAGRTSSFAFRGEAADIPTIGDRLGVGYVLEGSVRTEGTQVRITAQLSSVRDGFQVWSRDYDRELNSVFAIQEDIARQIVAALEVELTAGSVEEAWASRTTPEAYRAYLKGRQAFHELSGDGWVRALEEFARAVELDSTFAPGQSGVAAAHYAMGYFGLRPWDEVVPLARRGAERALELNPNLAEPHATLGLVALYRDRHWEEAEREIRLALELNPNDALVRHAYGDLLTILGDPEGGVRQVELGQEADPLSLLASFPAAAHLAFVGRYEEMIDRIGALRERFPDRPNVGRGSVSLALWHLGRRDEALDLYRPTWAEDPQLLAVADAAAVRGGPQAAIRAWAEYRADRYDGSGALEIAHLYARAGASDEVFRWLDVAVERPAPALLHVVAHPDFQSLHDDPRFQVFLDRLGIPVARR